MPVWYDQPSVANRLAHPFAHPGGPSVVVEPAAASRQSVQEFQDQATAALSELLSNIQQGLHEQEAQQAVHGQPDATDQLQQQPAGLDLSDIAVPLLPRRRLTGPVLLVPQSEDVLPGMTPEAAAGLTQRPRSSVPVETLMVPAGCLELMSWRESAAAEEPPGEVVANTGTVVLTPAATKARGTAAAVGGVNAAAADEVLQPGSEVVVTLMVMDTDRLLSAVHQEIQALGSNTLADVRDAITCPTNTLAEGLGASNSAAYFYINGRFFDDTRSTAASECSQLVEHWAQQLCLAGPRHLLRHDQFHEAPQPQKQPPLPQQQGKEQELQQGIEQLRSEAGVAAGPGGEQPQQGQRVEPGRDMQHVRLAELALQASNRPMVLYSHQGLCEHAVVVSDVRLLHAADPGRRSAYPRTVHRAGLGRRMHCGVCKRSGATALMLDHPETPEAVIVLCRLCCGLFSVEQHPGAKLIMLEEFPAS